MTYKSTALLLLLSTLFLWSCGDKADFRNSVVPATGARVKFYHTAPDAAGVDIYVNDQKLSGVNTVPPAVPAPLTYTNSFPNQDYALLTPGTAKVKIVTPASTTATTDATLATADLTTQADTYYSVFLYGTAPTYNTLTLTDNLTVQDPAQAYVRFVNLVSGADAAATYDLVVNGTVVVAGVSPLKGVGYVCPDTSHRVCYHRCSGADSCSGNDNCCGHSDHTATLRGSVLHTCSPGYSWRHHHQSD